MEMLAGQYRIDAMAGSGGFGDVYKGYDVRMDRPVAIKRVAMVGDSEAAILRELDHKGLPRLYDILHAGDDTYMVMEWIEGTDLGRYIEASGALPEETAVRIGLELLEILEYLHGRSPSIIYQDLKPANIMLGPDGHVKLVDFGTAVILTHNDTALAAAGTVGYGSPEQRGFLGHAYADERSDIYAWGAVMYSMMSGISLCKPPYTMNKIRQACPQISFGLERVISKAVSRAPAGRYANTADVKEALKRGPVCDLLHKILFAVLCAVAVGPFLYAWYAAHRDGLFSWLRALLLSLHSLWRSGEGCGMRFRLHHILEIGSVLKQQTVIERSYACERLIGMILISGVWMAAGLKLIRMHKFLHVNRSVYLSDKHFPGLWAGALLAGVLFGYGLGGNSEAVVSYAAASETIGDSNDGSYEGSGKILPVSVCTSDGENILVDFGSSYDPDGDLHIKVDGSVLTADDMTLEMRLRSGDEEYYRRLYLR